MHIPTGDRVLTGSQREILLALLIGLVVLAAPIAMLLLALTARHPAPAIPAPPSVTVQPATQISV